LPQPSVKAAVALVEELRDEFFVFAEIRDGDKARQQPVMHADEIEAYRLAEDFLSLVEAAHPIPPEAKTPLTVCLVAEYRWWRFKRYCEATGY